MYRASVTPDQKTVLQAFIDQLTNVDATLLISALKVSRPLDGALITPLY